MLPPDGLLRLLLPMETATLALGDDIIARVVQVKQDRSEEIKERSGGRV